MAQRSEISPSDSISPDRQKWFRADQIRGIEWGVPQPRAEAAAKTSPSDSLSASLVADDQDPKVVAKLLARVRELCTATEEVRYIAVQKKPVVTLSPDALVATTRRLIMLKTGLLGKAELLDFVWRDVQDASIQENILSATFSVTTVNGKRHSMDSIPKKQARALYRIAQEIEERSREERRQRKMEEDRARAGGIQLPTPQMVDQHGAKESVSDALRSLKTLHAEGLITDSEYEAKRQQIIARM